jgi:hypothetical protein
MDTKSKKNSAQPFKRIQFSTLLKCKLRPSLWPSAVFPFGLALAPRVDYLAGRHLLSALLPGGYLLTVVPYPNIQRGLLSAATSFPPPKEREQAVLDRAGRIFALRLTRMLNADGALPLEPPARLKRDAETAETRSLN